MANGPQEVDIVAWIHKISLELFGQGGLGYSFGALEGKNDEFNQALDELPCV